MTREAEPASTQKQPIVIRKMDFPFDDTIPRWWFSGEPLPTHVVNALHLLFPEGERFFVRSVRRYLQGIDDPALKERAKGFFGQEGRHGREHERFADVLRAQGYDIDTFLTFYRKVGYGWIEPATPAWLHLSVTAALEHFTATLAEGALTSGELDNAHPALRDLLLWHAAEEIEHKSVAYDVLLRADDRYSVRVAGLAVAAAVLLGFWSVGFAMLLAQEHKRGLTLRAMLQGVRGMAKAGPRSFPRAIRDYLRPSFHPDQHDNGGLARSYLEKIGRLAS
jgi:uncharacterized protein